MSVDPKVGHSSVTSYLSHKESIGRVCEPYQSSSSCEMTLMCAKASNLHRPKLDFSHVRHKFFDFSILRARRWHDATTNTLARISEIWPIFILCEPCELLFALCGYPEC